MSNIDTATVTVDTFENFAGQEFSMAVGGSILSLVLTEVQPRPPLPAEFGIPRQPFSLIFEGTRGTRCPQGTYSLTHPELGIFQLFLVAIGERAPGPVYRYQAIVS